MGWVALSRATLTGTEGSGALYSDFVSVRAWVASKCCGSDMLVSRAASAAACVRRGDACLIRAWILRQPRCDLRGHVASQRVASPALRGDSRREMGVRTLPGATCGGVLPRTTCEESSGNGGKPQSSPGGALLSMDGLACARQEK